jgi:formate hydrogenlyase transcriptional activator
MEQMHSLLKLQIRRYLSGPDSLPKEWQGFIDAVNMAYLEFDASRGTLERPPELTPQLLEANPDFRAIFERLIHSSMDGIFAFDRDYRYTLWNPAVERILGLNRLQTLGQSAFDVFPFLKDTEGEKFYRDALAGKTVVASDRLYTVPGTGEQIFVEGHFSPLIDDLGKIIGGLAILRDVTERKRAEELRAARSRQAALRADVSVAFASENHLSAILHACAEAIVQQLDAAFARIWTTNEDGDMLQLQASAGLYTHLNGPHSRVPVGKLKIGLIAQERSPHLTNDVVNDPRISDRAWAKREGMVAFAGYPLVAGDRLVGVMALFARTALMPDSLDALASVAGLIAQGIERKRAEDSLRKSEAALRERERELQQLVDVVPHNILVFGADGSVLYANRGLRTYFGLTLKEVQADDFRARVYHPDDLERARFERERAMSRGAGWETEARILRSDGQYRWFLIRANPHRDEQGCIVRWYSTGTDIHDRKQAEDALRGAQGELQRERDRLKLLLELTNQVISNLELREMLRALAASIRRIMHCDAVSIRLPDPENTHLRVHALDFPESKGFLKEETLIPVEGSLSGRVFRAGKPYVSDDLATDAATSPGLAEGLKSGCFLPLIHRDRVLGVMGLGRREDTFTPEEVGFLAQAASQVAIAVENAVAYRQIADLKDQLAQEKLYLEDEIRTEQGFEEIIGRSGALRDVLRQIGTVAPTGSTVLINGETGTGKELIARAIHNLSPRSTKPFVKLNCAAIPTGLLESELFGHEKGAFTGAIAQRIGRFELAHQGTVFLDEIGDVPLDLQPKLLRVLQEREFERLGSVRTFRTDARLIAATNRDLAAMVGQRTFREDLFYRLNVFPVHLPPLRERQEDIPLLVRHFVHHFAQRMKRDIDTIPSETMDALCQYHWPGNIRELQNLIERAVILSIGRILKVPLTDLKTRGAPVDPKKHDTLEEAERKHILAVLEDTNWVLGGPNGAALRLGMKRATLQHRLRKLGISRPGK